MRDSRSFQALLPNLGGAHLPPVALSIPGELQFCVDAGASAATCFFDDITAIGLHDHIAASMHAFTRSLDDAMARADSSTRQWLTERKQRCVDAFGAGYLGRIQQELRLFHGEDVMRGRGVSDSSSVPATNMH